MGIRILVVGLTLAGTPVAATTYQANPGNFATVFMAAQGGDTIVVQGNFGATDLVGRSFTVPLTIDASAATFDNSLLIKNVDGVNFTGGTFGSTTGPVRYNAAIASFSDTRLSFTNANVVGARAGFGIALMSDANVQVTNSQFTGLDSGVAVGLSSQVTLDHNQSIRSSSDGFDIAGSHMVTVTNSTCTDSAPSAGAHPDCVQLYSIKDQPVQSDITVTHNSATGATQGFTAFTPENGGGLRYNISYNTAALSFPQGVACYACVDSVISFNTLTTLPGSAHPAKYDINGGADNIVFGNTADGAAAPNQSPFPQPFDPAFPADPFDAINLAITDLSPALANATQWSDATFAGQTTSATAAAPEPLTWMMFVVGFGAIGAMSRRRAAAVREGSAPRTRTVAVTPSSRCRPPSPRSSRR